MEQLLAHLVGDYLLQFGWLARQKARNIWVAMLHAAIYVLPFFVLCHATWWQAAIIVVTHGIQDHLLWRNFNRYASGLEFGITVVRDNTLHMLVNWLVL